MISKYCYEICCNDEHFLILLTISFGITPVPQLCLPALSPHTSHIKWSLCCRLLFLPILPWWWLTKADPGSRTDTLLLAGHATLSCSISRCGPIDPMDTGDTVADVRLSRIILGWSNLAGGALCMTEIPLVKISVAGDHIHSRPAQ